MKWTKRDWMAALIGFAPMILTLSLFMALGFASTSTSRPLELGMALGFCTAALLVQVASMWAGATGSLFLPSAAAPDDTRLNRLLASVLFRRVVGYGSHDRATVGFWAMPFFMYGSLVLALPAAGIGLWLLAA